MENLIIGFLGQGIFASRFIIQWIYSEKKGESLIPITFWLTEFKRLFQSVNFKKSLKVLRFLKKSLIHKHPLSM